MIKDPVCDMTITEDTAKAKSVYQGRTYFFCSMLCKQLFEREPQKYIPPPENHEKAHSA